ncbi:type VII secretion-associated serine protease mycosin [Candidatus Mycobacterium methanotrophicum]|uniref:Type VII secretion-associated serine protease mycosin n=1 Tax=Candidatus Mycobacterium methanotrophicum TaxID=2943498 RepID=A0ABY4QJI8_9MYCO|nr:type VII secretion-associated serine protease mycosin [Candidatus Mycobacterium methanotrophicum]UQX10508.1 type VII secretion-associated serine protease mycosin [Candidatus Mycobacterium methanotrophicum]
MTTAQCKALRCVTVVMIAALPQYGMPAAYAVSPPPIDSSRLPEPAPARPPQPTVQRSMCAVPSMAGAANRADAPSQLSGLDLAAVWRLTRGAGQRVAVIDTGVSPHSRLPDTAAGGDYVFTGDGTQDCDGHGTAVAGIIAAAPDSHHHDGFSGVAPEVSLISIRQSSAKFGAVADPSNTGSGDVDTMAAAVRTAADLGASVINISAVACIRTGSVLDDRALGAALSYAVDIKNAVVVVAAGNTGAGQCPAQRPEATWDNVTVAVSPAWYDDYVLTVGSVNARGEPSSFTLAGPWVDVAAPGEAVISLSSSGDGLMNTLGGPDGTARLSGTSYAAPVVSGLAALIRSRFPRLTARQVMQRIEATAHHPPGGRDPLVGAGVVDLLAAVSTDPPVNPSPSPPHTPVPIAAPPRPAPANHGARDTALRGAAICGGVLAAVVLAGTLMARLRRD